MNANRLTSSPGTTCVPAINENVFLLRDDVSSLQPLGALFYRELHKLALLQTAVSIRLDGRKVYKYVITAIATDESVTFCGIEPFDGPNDTFVHSINSI
jgi:hypothetical protein